MVEQDFNGEFLPDWADKRAREWITAQEVMTSRPAEEASLAALLREENARLRGDLRIAQDGTDKLACAAAGLKQCCEEQRAEVSRLEGLILDWWSRVSASPARHIMLDLMEEYRRIRAGESRCPKCEGTGATGAGVPCCNVDPRIRAQREEGR